MFKRISTTAIAVAIFAGAIVTPAFAKGGYLNKYSVTSNRSVESITVARRVAHLKRIDMPKLGRFIIW